MLKKLIVSTVGEAMSIRVAKPRQVHPHEEGSQWLSLVLPLSKTYHCWINLPGLSQALEVLRHCLIHRAVASSDMATVSGNVQVIDLS